MSVTAEIIMLLAVFFGGLFLSVWGLFFTAEAKELMGMSKEEIDSLEAKLKGHKNKLDELNKELEKEPSVELLKAIAIEEHHIRVTEERLAREWLPDYQDIKDIRERNRL